MSHHHTSARPLAGHGDTDQFDIVLAEFRTDVAAYPVGTETKTMSRQAV